MVYNKVCFSSKMREMLSSIKTPFLCHLTSPPMAPISLSSISRSFNSDISHTSNALREQWITPTDIFSVLLILGGDVIARALAQLAGSGFAPVTFSFG